MENGHDNTGKLPDQIVISLVRDPWQVTIDGSVENLNLCLAMLDEVRRVIDTKWRIAAAIEAQEEHKKEQAGNARVASIIGRVPARR